MDVTLQLADYYILDAVYPQNWQKDDIYRQIISLFFITWLGGLAIYYIFATLNFYFIFDKQLMKHPKFLKNQINKEIILSMKSMPVMAILTVPWFLGEVRGYSKLHLQTPTEVSDYLDMAVSILGFLAFTDMAIYWIHRWEHHPLLYPIIHKPHHRWIIPTPFASHAFHPFDGYAQSVPYHMYIFLFPMHSYLYLLLFVLINLWTISIHDGYFMTEGGILNSSAHHAVHHTDFLYNYGQYTTFWDKMGGTYRKPKEALFKTKQAQQKIVFNKQS